MSNSIQKKFLDLEATPPEAVWQKIASGLDDAALEYKFPKRLSEFAVLPPSGTWDKIADRLEHAQDAGEISHKLLAAEVQPPAFVWNNIKLTLDAEHEAAVPEHRRLSPLVRYAAAAAVIGFLAFGASRLLKQDKNGYGLAGHIKTEQVKEGSSHAAEDAAQSAREQNSTESNIAADEARNDAALEASKKTFASLNVPAKTRSEIASAFHFSSYIDPAAINDHSYGYEEALSPEENNANRYIVLMTPDGHFIRVSKKLSNLVCCVSGEEADQQCKSQVDKWRKQLACSEASHPGNFMDILSLVGSLQDNQQ